MGRIATTFRRLRKANEAALIPYLMVGRPSLDATRQLLPVIARQGADLIAFGVFGAAHGADPSSESDAALSVYFQVAAEARRSNDVPLILIGHRGFIDQYGYSQFATDCAQSGIDGLIVPNLPVDEADELITACQGQGIDYIAAVVGFSTDESIRRAAEISSGFICCYLPDKAIDPHSQLSKEAKELIARFRRHTALPIVAGGDLKADEDVHQVAQVADGALVHSPFYDLIESLDEEELILGVSDCVRDLKAATSRLA